jgi:hypothetical protein
VQTTAGCPVLLIGAGIREYHVHSLLQVAATRPLVIVDRAIPNWARPYLAGQIITDLAAGAETATAVREFTETQSVSGVVTYLPAHAALTARLARMLGLPGNPPAAVAPADLAPRVRRTLQEHRVPTMSSYRVSNEDSAVAAARMLDGPASVTAPGGEPLRADDDNAVRTAFRTVCARMTTDTLALPVTVEDFGLDGMDIGVEAVLVSSDDVRVVAITRKDVNPAVAASPVGYSVCAHEPLLHDDTLQAIAAQAITVLGFTTGVVHADVRLSASGPHVLRVTPCLAEDLVPLLVARATGINLARAATEVALGHVPNLSPTLKRAAAVRFLYPSVSGQLAYHSQPKAYMAEPWLDRFTWTHQPDDGVLSSPFSSSEDRLAHWVVTGADSSECASRLDLVPYFAGR